MLQLFPFPGTCNWMFGVSLTRNLAIVSLNLTESRLRTDWCTRNSRSSHCIVQTSESDTKRLSPLQKKHRLTVNSRFPSSNQYSSDFISVTTTALWTSLGRFLLLALLGGAWFFTGLSGGVFGTSVETRRRALDKDI